MAFNFTEPQAQNTELWYTITGLLTLGELTRTIHDHPLVVSNASLNAAFHIAKMHRSMKDVVLEKGDDAIRQAVDVVSREEQVVFHELNTIRADILGTEGQLLERQTRRLFVDWRAIREEVVRLLTSGNRDQAVLMTKSIGADHVARLEGKTLELSLYARCKASVFLALAEKKQSNLFKSTVVLTLSGTLIAALIAFSATCRVIESERVLLDEKNKLQLALDEIKTLRGIIPICSHCRQIRDDEGIWKKVEEYIDAHSDAKLSHGICPECMEEHYPEFAATYREEEKGG
ncbi:MAG: hypothetical protein HN742_42370 [Lentisphaerae bacterium]|jgi:hypothetical protein|nr:hypothetical protein [Lentisphaerota bacterium]MBT5605950.1 hypothetical protein [Lentisphaerota bacterium]MBT7056018.1 hypothetical protein [Lentisphaerota bacterium]MBT7848584.1 hypothetical protein [Lentisphaerota bacterium]